MSTRGTERDAAHLYDIVRAARLIVQFTEATDAQTFKTDDFTRSALLHQLATLTTPHALPLNEIRTSPNGRLAAGVDRTTATRRTIRS